MLRQKNTFTFSLLYFRSFISLYLLFTDHCNNNKILLIIDTHEVNFYAAFLVQDGNLYFVVFDKVCFHAGLGFSSIALWFFTNQTAW